MYKCPQSFGKAIVRVKKILPNDAMKSGAIIEKLAETILSKKQKTSTNLCNTLSDIGTDISTELRAFYERDDISRQSPGKRDTKTVISPNSKRRTVKQKRHLIMTSS